MCLSYDGEVGDKNEAVQLAHKAELKASACHTPLKAHSTEIGCHMVDILLERRTHVAWRETSM